MAIGKMPEHLLRIELPHNEFHRNKEFSVGKSDMLHIIKDHMVCIGFGVQEWSCHYIDIFPAAYLTERLCHCLFRILAEQRAVNVYTAAKFIVVSAQIVGKTAAE